LMTAEATSLSPTEIDVEEININDLKYNLRICDRTQVS
jgi:hypothetical protein